MRYIFVLMFVFSLVAATAHYSIFDSASETIGTGVSVMGNDGQAMSISEKYLYNEQGGIMWSQVQRENHPLVP